MENSLCSSFLKSSLSKPPVLQFTKKKFLALPQINRYKKASDQLKGILLYCPSDWPQMAIQYNEWMRWMDAEAHTIPEKSLNTSKVMECYLYWRKKGGLGAERDLFNSYTNSDRDTPSGKSIDWSLLLHNIRSGYNVGSAIRTADCFGLRTIHMTGYTPEINNKSLKSSAMDAETWMESTRWDNPFHCLDNLSKETSIIALETDPEGTPIHEFSWPEKGLLIVGNEELGIPQEVLVRADHRVTIPMYGRKASLNVANALSITLFQLRSFLEKSTKP